MSSRRPVLLAVGMAAIVVIVGAGAWMLGRWVERTRTWRSAWLGEGRSAAPAARGAFLPVTRVWTYEPSQRPQPAWPEPGKELHRMDFDHAPQPVMADGRVYFGSSADDTVRALDAATGRRLWRFASGGPVRFPPVVAGGRVWFGSDDGHVYCLNAADGSLVWKLHGGPSDEQLLGNGRMISRWPVRTGVCVADGAAYFAAGMWPALGIYVYALDAASGRPIWCNDSAGSMYVDTPHVGASAFTGVSPQGQVQVGGDVVLVPCGRSVPAAFDRKTGAFRYYHLARNKHDGGWRVTVAGSWFLNPSHIQVEDQEACVGEAPPQRGDGLAGYELSTGLEVRGLALEAKHIALADGNTLYAAGDDGVWAFDMGKLTGQADILNGLAWRADHGRAYSLVRDGRSVLVGGAGSITAFDAASGEQAWRVEVDGQVRGLAAGGGRIIAATETGRLACFEPCSMAAPPAIIREPMTWEPARPGEHVAAAAGIIRRTGVTSGYAVVAGAPDAQLAAALAAQTDLHVLCPLETETLVAAERNRILTTDLHGKRLAVTVLSDPRKLPYSPYFADLVVVAGSPGGIPARELWRILRPCGGVMCFAGADRQTAERTIREASAENPTAEVRTEGGEPIVRRGPLSGSADWRYPWADGACTGMGQDARIKLPLDLLWFGGAGPDRMMDRHWGTSTPLVVGGRVFITGQHHIIAFDAYNGREHWCRPFQGAGRMNATWDSANLVADEAGVYLAAEAFCHRLDQATGKTLAVYPIPPAALRAGAAGQPAESKPVDVDWPTTWQVFGPMPETASILEPNDLKAVPRRLSVDGKEHLPRELATVSGALDFTYLYGGFGFKPLAAGQKPTVWPRGVGQFDARALRSVAYAFAEIRCPAPGRLTVGAGADWWMAWYLDGNCIYDTLVTGNQKKPYAPTNHVFWTDVSAGRHVLAVRVEAGSLGWCVVSAGGAKYEPQLASALAELRPRWGYVSIADDLLLGTYVPPKYLNSEAAALFALDKYSGAVRWVYAGRPAGPPDGQAPLGDAQARLANGQARVGDARARPADGQVLANAAIAFGDGRLFLLESLPQDEIDRARRRGELTGDRQSLVALDLAGGKELWRREGVTVPRGAMLQYARGVVVAAGGAAYDAATGSELWWRSGAYRLVGRVPVLWKDWIITHPDACDLRTGKLRQATDPLTGRLHPWEYVRAYGCGQTVGAGDILLFRSGMIGLLDLASDGTTTFGAVRPGCSVNLVPANGLIVSPEGSSGCTCSYNFQTSLALVPAERAGETWYVLAGEEVFAPVKAVRVNLGAPGDRRDGQAVWLGYPRPDVRGACPVPMSVYAKAPSWLYRPSLAVEPASTLRPWLYTSALCGQGEIVLELPSDPNAAWAASTQPARMPARSFTVRLHFLEPDDGPPGQRVFGVSLQGRPVLENLDIAAQAGGPRRALVREFRGVQVTGELKLALQAIRGEPLLCALEVVLEAPAPP